MNVLQFLSPLPNGWNQGQDGRFYDTHGRVSSVDPRGMPPDWEMRLAATVDPATGENSIYFACHSARETTYSDPRGLPPGWEQKMLVGNKRVLYVDHTNKKTTWDDPRLALSPIDRIMLLNEYIRRINLAEAAKASPNNSFLPSTPLAQLMTPHGAEEKEDGLYLSDSAMVDWVAQLQNLLADPSLIFAAVRALDHAILALLDVRLKAGEPQHADTVRVKTVQFRRLVEKFKQLTQHLGGEALLSGSGLLYDAERGDLSNILSSTSATHLQHKLQALLALCSVEDQALVGQCSVPFHSKIVFVLRDFSFAALSVFATQGTAKLFSTSDPLRAALLTLVSEHELDNKDSAGPAAVSYGDRVALRDAHARYLCPGPASSLNIKQQHELQANDLWLVSHPTQPHLQQELDLYSNDQSEICLVPCGAGAPLTVVRLAGERAGAGAVEQGAATTPLRISIRKLDISSKHPPVVLSLRRHSSGSRAALGIPPTDEMKQPVFSSAPRKKLKEGFRLAALRIIKDNINKVHEKAQKQKEELQRKAKEQQDEGCVICMDRACNSVLLECAHRCCCHECAKTQKNCPLCRSPITRVIKIRD